MKMGREFRTEKEICSCQRDGFEYRTEETTKKFYERVRVTVLTWSKQSKRPKSAMAALRSANCFYAWDNQTVSTVTNCHNYVVFITYDNTQF